MATKKSKSKSAPSCMRQGDVLLIPVGHPAAGQVGDVEPVPIDSRGVVLAEGEMSGHHHQVFARGGGDVHLMRFRDARADRLLVVGDGEGATVRVVGGGSGSVDRHTPIDIGPGKFIVRIQRQYDAGYARQVQD